MKIENLNASNPLEYIQYFFTDFRVKNMDIINQTHSQNIIDDYEKISVFFSKLLFHFPKFYSYSSKDKGTACIFAGFKYITETHSDLSSVQKQIICDWVCLMVDHYKGKEKYIFQLTDQIDSTFLFYKSNTQINHNLYKFYSVVDNIC